MNEQIAKLLEALSFIVNEDGLTWKEKRESIRAMASDDDVMNLEEFSSWFTPEE